jgi:hypothetical protein
MFIMNISVENGNRCKKQCQLEGSDPLGGYEMGCFPARQRRPEQLLLPPSRLMNRLGLGG